MVKKKKPTSYKDNLTTRSNNARIVRRIVVFIVLSLILIFVVGGVSGYKYIKTSLEPVDASSEEKVDIEIPMGSSSSDIAALLEEGGIIKDARVFRFYIKFKNEAGFQAGEYTFTPSFTLNEIIESLKSGKIMANPTFVITIPEGKTIEEMAEIYSKEMSFSKEDFIEKVNEEEYIEQLIEGNPSILTDEILNPDIRVPLEGYLFAATYSFYEDEPSIESIVEEMLKKTVSVVQPYLEDIYATQFTIHEAITFASLLEKEARTEEERKTISGVFYNRLEDGMKLQTDPTVAYAQGKHLDRVLIKDTEVESLYNTYYIVGLPIGPISNFAENALEATIHPADTNYIYFLHDFDGDIHYSETYDEHLRLKSKYRDRKDE